MSLELKVVLLTVALVAYLVLFTPMCGDCSTTNHTLLSGRWAGSGTCLGFRGTLLVLVCLLPSGLSFSKGWCRVTDLGPLENDISP